MLNQFSRTELLLGKEALDKFYAREDTLSLGMYAKP